MALPSQSLDTPTKLQLAIGDLCGLYTDALTRLLNKVEYPDIVELPEPHVTAADYGARIAHAHREIDDLAAVLSSNHRSEAAQLQRLHELSEERSAVTDELRAEVENAGACARVLLPCLIPGVTWSAADIRNVRCSQRTCAWLCDKTSTSCSTASANTRQQQTLRTDVCTRFARAPVSRVFCLRDAKSVRCRALVSEAVVSLV